MSCRYETPFKSSCIDKWGKTLSVDDFNEYTDIKGNLVESNSKYKVSGPNYSSRWIKASWYYFNEDIDIKEYGTDIVVGPVGSDSEITEAYADLNDFIIYDNDKDGWRLPTIKSVETACFSPKP